MEKDLLKKNQKTSEALNKSNKPSINQILMLQQTIGNKEVARLLEKGIIHKEENPASSDVEIVSDEKKQGNFEQMQIAKDKAALQQEIEQKLAAGAKEAEALKAYGSGDEVFVNVDANIVYAEIPGDRPQLFYHYLELQDFKLSNRNIDQQGHVRTVNRIQQIPCTFSFKYEMEGDILDKETEEKPVQENEEMKKMEKMAKEALEETAEATEDIL